MSRVDAERYQARGIQLENPARILSTRACEQMHGSLRIGRSHPDLLVIVGHGPVTQNAEQLLRGRSWYLFHQTSRDDITTIAIVHGL